MPSILPKYVRLGLANLAPKKSDKAVDVESVRPRNAIDPVTRKPTDTLDGYNLTFFGVNGCLQTVKLPLDAQPTTNKIDEALKNGSIVRANFGAPSTLDARFYAMVKDGQLLQGITAKAQKVEIVEIIEANNDFGDIEL